MIQTITTNSEAETISLGTFIGKRLQAGSVLALRGDLGAGKTHFVQGIALGMGIDAVITSPTFTILNYYEQDIPLEHFDFYRLEEDYELDDLGFDDYMGTGVAVIEWSEKFPDRIPADALMITIEKVDMNQRLFTFDFAAHKWQDLEKEVENYAVSH